MCGVGFRVRGLGFTRGGCSLAPWISAVEMLLNQPILSNNMDPEPPETSKNGKLALNPWGEQLSVPGHRIHLHKVYDSTV